MNLGFIGKGIDYPISKNTKVNKIPADTSYREGWAFSVSGQEF
jgi:hypothetical protein